MDEFAGREQFPVGMDRSDCRRAPSYTQFPPTSPEAFRTTLQSFTRKSVEVHCRPVLLKSPAHTERIPTLFLPEHALTNPTARSY